MKRILSFCIIICAHSSFANGPAIQAETAFATGLNGAAFRTFGKVVRKSSPDGQMTAWMMPIMIPYELVDGKLIVGLGLGLLQKNLDLANGTTRTSGFGIGDLILFGKFNIFQQDRHQETLRVAGKIGLTFPTATFDKADATGKLPLPLQLGTGSANPSIMLIVTKLWRRFGLNTDVGYMAMTEANGVNRGDILRYDLAASFRLTPWVYKTYPAHQLNMMLELNGAFTRQTRENGKIKRDTGGNVLFVSPGLQYMYDAIIVEASVQIPIPGVSFVNGNQMTTDFTGLLGIRWLIF